MATKLGKGRGETAREIERERNKEIDTRRHPE
jgi:hypothetical protein